MGRKVALGGRGGRSRPGRRGRQPAGEKRGGGSRQTQTRARRPPDSLAQGRGQGRRRTTGPLGGGVDDGTAVTRYRQWQRRSRVRAPSFASRRRGGRPAVSAHGSGWCSQWRSTCSPSVVYCLSPNVVNLKNNLYVSVL
ncbi:Os08g0148200 [Oryza sativa Japonica Group]|uniref:Os08g0148200 protein n=3 Tax=Oryza TaxID=4527 RepID=A0A0P0XBT4_ORYSJ|nr:Os08g0148200 [Oryza sativa Japonica Group]